jgi:phosphatidylcholine synthase
VGFPSYWNIVVAYLYLTGASPLISTLILLLLAALVFVPTRYIYITRFPRFKEWHFAGASISGVLMLAALWVSGPLRMWLVALSLIYPIYYTIYSLMLDWQARRAMR